MSNFKGFGSVPKQKLIKGWLLPECQKHYTDEAYNIESLKTTLNLWVACFCQRKIDKTDGFDAVVSISTSCFGLLCEIDTSLSTIQEKPFKQLLSRLRSDSDFYISFINDLYQKVKEKVFSGDTDELNILIKESRDYKNWLSESGVLSTSTNLIDGWAHPLSSSGDKVNGEETVNTWAFASLVCATATQRLPDGSKDRAISMLISEGVLTMETWETQIKLCQQLDSMYIQLINDLHSKLEQKIDKAFS